MKKVPLIKSRSFRDRFRSWRIGGKCMKIFNGITEIDEESLVNNFAFLHTAAVKQNGNKQDTRYVLHVIDKAHGQTYRFIKYASSNIVKIAIPNDPELVETGVGDFVKFLKQLTYIPVTTKSTKKKLEESADKN